MLLRRSLIFFTALILTIIVLAYLSLIPAEFNRFPYYDSIGHFILYGIWGYLFAKVFSKQVRLFNKYNMPLGVLIIVPVTILEESLQMLSSARTFSVFDLGWGILGIITACLVIHLKKKIVNRTVD